MPVAHADEHRQPAALPVERLAERGRLTLRELVQRRAAPRHLLVVMRDFFEPFRRNAPTARDDLQEGTDLLGRRRPAEGDQEHRVDGAAHRRADNSWTMSTSAFTCSTGVDGKIPWPRLKM